MTLLTPSYIAADRALAAGGAMLPYLARFTAAVTLVAGLMV